MDQLALIENLQREDLNAVETAQGYRRLMDKYGMTQEQLSEAVGKSRPAIANTLRILSLPEEILPMVANGSLSAGHAKAILSAPEERREALAKKLRQRVFPFVRRSALRRRKKKAHRNSQNRRKNSQRTHITAKCRLPWQRSLADLLK